MTLQGHELGGEAILLRYPNNTGSPGSQAIHPSTNPVAPVKKKQLDGWVVLRMCKGHISMATCSNASFWSCIPTLNYFNSPIKCWYTHFVCPCWFVVFFPVVDALVNTFKLTVNILLSCRTANRELKQQQQEHHKTTSLISKYINCSSCAFYILIHSLAFLAKQHEGTKFRFCRECLTPTLFFIAVLVLKAGLI